MEDRGRTGRTADMQRRRPRRLARLADSQARVRSAVGLRQTCMTHVNTQLHLRHRTHCTAAVPNVPLYLSSQFLYAQRCLCGSVYLEGLSR